MQHYSDRQAFLASSRNAQSPRAVFGRSARTPFGADDSSGALGQGPAAYETAAATRAARSAAPRAAFARASRDGGGRLSAAYSPAPNSYDTGNAALLRLSSHPSAPRARIGSAPRDRHSITKTHKTKRRVLVPVAYDAFGCLSKNTQLFLTKVFKLEVTHR
jgi:hypothetical protein